MIEKNQFMTLTFKVQILQFCAAFEILTGIISRMVQDREIESIEVE